MNCPECGAPEISCNARLEEFLALEFTDPGFGRVHHLTVAAYMLQHSSRLSREGWLYERQLLGEFLVENKSPERIRRQNQDLVDSGRRAFKFESRDGLPVIHKTAWAKTILDVRTETPDVYCADVTAWARTALEEAERLGGAGASEILKTTRV